MLSNQKNETVLEHLTRLLLESREQEALIRASTARAVAESRLLLAQVRRDHPDIR